MLYYHIRRMVHDHQDADDVLQNTFLKAWRYMDRFRGDSALRTWLYRIATNEALTFISNKKKRQYSDLGELEDNLVHSQGHGIAPEAEEIQQKLQKAIAQLPERQRLVFSLVVGGLAEISGHFSHGGPLRVGDHRSGARGAGIAP